MTNKTFQARDSSSGSNGAFGRIAPFLAFIGILALRDLVGNGLPDDGVDLRWLYVVQAGVAAIALLHWRRTYIEFAPAPTRLLALTASCALGIGVFLMWILPMPTWLHIGVRSTPFVPLNASGSLRWDLILVRTAGAVLVVPIMEELFWRSFLMRWIDQRDFLHLRPESASWMGVLASSAVFALGHDLWAAAFIAGLVYAMLYRRSGNLWYAVIAHAVTNLALAVWVIERRAWQYW